MQWTTRTNFAIRHTMTNSSKQLQLQHQQCSNTPHSSRQVYEVYEYILVRRAAAYSIIIIIDQVQVLCLKPHTVST